MIDTILADNLTDKICKFVWSKGRMAATIIGQSLALQYPHEADPQAPGYVGVFDEHAGTEDVRAAVRYTLGALQP